MQKDVILYKRNNVVLRSSGIFLAVISIIIICITIVDSIYNNIAIEFNSFLFPIVLIIVGVCINKFTGYTTEILVSYNENGFRKSNTEFIEWSHLKSWSLKRKRKIPDPALRGLYLNEPYSLFGFIPGAKTISTLKLELDDKRTILFSEEEIGDITKFIHFLYKNQQDKLKRTKK